MIRKNSFSDHYEIFFYFFLLTTFFLLLEISFFIQCNRYLSDFSFMTDRLKIPATIIPGVLFFLLVQLIIHFGYCLIAWVVTLLAADFLQITKQKRLLFGIGIWTLGIVTLLVANQYFFSNSKFAELTTLVLFNQEVTKVIWILLLGISSFFIFLAFIALVKITIPFLSSKIFYTLAIPIILVGWISFRSAPLLVLDGATEARPNIIIIGVDSLRPDFLGYFGHEPTTPFFDEFLEKSTVFSEAVTPLARTFPSWASILSGQYPKEIGIRTNLQELTGISFASWLPTVLRQNGYETLYATDETRFSNIDSSFGFDRAISPPIGLNDFLLGTFNDFPLSNLLINTDIGKWIFPYSYANRPVYPSYDPNSFLSMLRPALQKPRTKPLFFAIHFCLTHYPYLWANLSGRELNITERYAASIIRVDQQLDDFFTQLEQANLLNHAIVVLLSDHGEALELPGDRITERDLFLTSRANKTIPQFYPPSLDDEDINQSAGHGGDVLGLPQYHTLLAFRLYGTGKQQQGVFPGVVSLLDIKPTLLHLIGLPLGKTSGDSLADIVKGKGKLPLQHHIFLESDISPEAIRTVYPEVRKVLLEGIELFQIDPKTTRLTTKPSMTKMIVRSKQYADIYGNWMLALYPQDNINRMPILVNLVNGEWTNDLHSKFAKASPVKEMLVALRTFYGDEINQIN